MQQIGVQGMAAGKAPWPRGEVLLALKPSLSKGTGAVTSPFSTAFDFTPLRRWVKMVRISVLHDALKTMYNAEKRGKRQVLIRPASKVVIKFLQLMQKHDYIGDFEFVDDHRAGKIVVQLNGRLNKCGCISPRYDVGHEVCSSHRSEAP